MRRETLPKRVEQDILIQQVGDELLLYDEVRHQAFCLNPVCAAVWTLCDGKHSISALAEAAGRQLKLAVEEQIVWLALEELLRDGLLEPLQDAAEIPSLSRRDLVQRLGARGALLLPIVAAIAAPTAAQAYNGCVDCDARSPHPRSGKTN